MGTTASEDGVLDGLSDRVEDLVDQALRLHRKQAVFVVLFQHCDVFGPLLVSFADEVLGIARQALQAEVLGFELGRVDVCVEELAGHGVDSARLQLVDRLVHRLFEHANQVGVDAHRLKQVDLRLSLREAIDDPAVDAAVGLADALIDQAQEDLVRDGVAVLGSLLQLHLDGRVLLSLSLEDLHGAHIDKAESIRDLLSLGGLATAGRSDYEDLRRAAWGVVAVTDAEHASEVVGNLILSAIGAVNGVDELVEGVHDGVHVDVVLLVDALSDLVGHVAVDILRRGNKVLLDAGKRRVLPNLQVDELVGDDAHALQGEGLDARAREALNDPALALLLVASDLLLNELDDNVVVNCGRENETKLGVTILVLAR